MNDEATGAVRAPRYAWYVLAILTLVYVLNFVDRQIVAILASDIKRDLRVDDQYIGFLYGTAFGVFYALFGVPLAALADGARRTRLMAGGLALWSAMTALSAGANGPATLAAARIGVGVGEASANPAAYSLLSDWFPRRLRATALSLYSSGIYLGGGLSLFVGGVIVRGWDGRFGARPPFGLHGWQAAFLAVGVPGLAIAAWVTTLREPPRGASDGMPTQARPAPLRGFAADLFATLPPLTLFGAARRGSRALAINLLAAGIAVSAARLAIAADGPHSVAQWIAVATGSYAVFSWGSALRARDPDGYALTLGNRALIAVVVCYAMTALVAYGVTAFGATFARERFGVPADIAGLWIGGPMALSGFLGVTLGGRAADLLLRRMAQGRIAVMLFGALAPVPAIVLAFTASRAAMLYVMLPVAQFLFSTALGASAAATQDLVPPDRRGTATAVFQIGTTLLGLAIGPYTAGRISVATGSLATGVLALLAAVPVGVVAGIAAWRWVPAAEARVPSLTKA